MGGTPANFCEEMRRAWPPDGPELQLVVYPGAPHAFDMRLPDRTLHGMRLGLDESATADARRVVLAFLDGLGLIPPGTSH